MAERTDNPLELVLQLCSAAAPDPWYPSAYAKAAAINRDSLDPHLDKLRLAGLIRLTDWMPGTGQGYVLTPAGKDLLANPRALALLRSGNLRLDAQAPEPPLLDESATKLFARGDAVRDVFMVQTPARVTYALIFANLLIFGYGFQMAQQKGVPADEYLGTKNLFGEQRLTPQLVAVYRGEGAMQAEDIVKGDWWRLLTCCFMHMGILHLASNLYSLYVIGPLTERMWGHYRYLILYLLAGLGGSCAMAYYTEPGVVGGGASGAIFGVMTSLMAWLVLNREHMPRPFVNNLLRRLFNVFLLNVCIGFVPGISMSAHLGGAAAGIVVSLLLHGNLHGRALIKFISTVGLVLFPLLCFGGLTVAQRHDPNWERMDYNFRLLPKMVDAQERAKAQEKPLIDRRIQIHSEQDLREAIQTQKEVVQILSVGERAGSDTRPYRDAKVEDDRQKSVRILGSQIADAERLIWQFWLRPAARDETRDAARTFRQKAQPLLTLPPAARQKESVDEAEAKLKEQTGKLEGMRQVIELAGPFQSVPDLEKSRTEEVETLTFYLDLLKSAATGLSEGGAWSDEKRRRYEELESQLKAK
jgi:membrane associated rhomboid family serine protease